MRDRTLRWLACASTELEPDGRCDVEATDETAPTGRFLEPLGISAAAEALYAVLLQGGVPPRSADAELDELVRARLARRGDDGPVALPARLAVEAWAADREAEVTRAREGAARLAALQLGQVRGPAAFLQVQHGIAASRDVFSRITLGARTEVLSMERGPYVTPPSAGTAPEQPVVSARGVSVRTVYDESITANEVVLALVRDSQAMGEKARVFSEVPLRMMLIDRRQALIVLPRTVDPEHPQLSLEIDTMLVSASPLLDALLRLFELIWSLAIPIDLVGPGAEPEEGEQRELLSMLSAGLTDASIARSLGVSERTVQRRIGRLQELLNASTRYQLGVQAARRGWI